MKIAFIIASINSKSNGLGGHYHSLLETVTQIAKKHEVVIINIGDSPAKALENCEFKSFSIIHKGAALVISYFQLLHFIEIEKPDILHAFDASAYYWVRLVGYKLKIPFCLTKCGGVNQVYFPYTDNLILFSSENLEYFKKKRKFKYTNFSFIPNRIKQFEDDKIRIEKINSKLGQFGNAFKFLRITRIGNYYQKSSLQLIQLVKQLTIDGLHCCAIFIGTVEDDSYLIELKNSGNENIFFFTEDEYNRNAKTLIHIADAVLGTGRSFMEAAAKQKILLSPVNKGSIPALITNKNFDEAFYYNFSERICFADFEEEKNYRDIKALIRDTNELILQKQFAKSVFNDFFNADKITEKYEDFYSKITTKQKRHYFDFFLHTLFLIRNYYRK